MVHKKNEKTYLFKRPRKRAPLQARRTFLKHKKYLQVDNLILIN